MIDHSKMRLGRRGPAKMDPKRLMLRNYLVDLPPAPPSQDWVGAIAAWGVMLNDKLGDCTVAARGHAIQTWTANASSIRTLTDDQVLQSYKSWAGYDPGDSSTDHGAFEVDILNRWRRDGLALDGHAIEAYADIDPANIEHWKQAILLLGGVYIGIDMPIEWADSAVWDRVGRPGTWGGHAVWVPRYNEIGPVCVTWGALKQMTWAAVNDPKYCEEVHALVSQDFLFANGNAPSGFKLERLLEDLNALT